MFLESIKINNGKRINLEGHNHRMNYCRNQHFHEIRDLDLNNKIIVPEKYKKGIVKCRVTYGRNIESIQFEKYTFRNPRSLKLIGADHLNYAFKYADRKPLESLFRRKKNADDIIIIKNGLITDSYYANLAISKGGIWCTPKCPLLKGTQREKLIKKGRLIEKDISIDELFQFKFIRILNAMTEWGMHKPLRISSKTIIK